MRGGGGASGLFVLDARHRQRRLRAARPSRRVSLASNMKLFTTATALGAARAARRRIPTKVESTGGVDRQRASSTAASTWSAAATRRSARRPSTTGFLGGLGTNLFALKRQLRAAGIERGHRAASTPTTRSSTACAASPTPATRPAPTSALSPASPSTPATRARTQPASPPTRPGWRRRSWHARCDAAGVDLRPQVALGKAPADAETVAVVALADDRPASSTPPTSTRTTSSPRR